MKEIKQAPQTMLKFSGSPVEIGSQIWERMCLPAIGITSKAMPQQQLAQLYAGFMLSAMGAMVADFGHEQAIAYVNEVTDKFIAEAPTLGEATSVQ